jgi:hypothetical protein
MLKGDALIQDGDAEVPAHATSVPNPGSLEDAAPAAGAVGDRAEGAPLQAHVLEQIVTEVQPAGEAQMVQQAVADVTAEADVAGDVDASS